MVDIALKLDRIVHNGIAYDMFVYKADFIRKFENLSLINYLYMLFLSNHKLWCSSTFLSQACDDLCMSIFICGLQNFSVILLIYA